MAQLNERTPQALLEIDALTLDFAGVRALDGVSFDMTRGSLTAVIGPNGAGKTSLFNCISGVYRPTSGAVRFDGEDIVGTAPHRITALGIGRMFQNLALFDQLTVLDNMMLGRHHLYETGWMRQLAWTPAARREEVRHREVVERFIDFLHLERWRKMPVAVLPYGVKKRVELGRALCMEPKLLLLDEPAAGLNQEETEDMARFILDVKEELGITQLLIEHELHMVLDLADDVVVLDFGRKIAHGTPDDVRRHEAVLDAYVGREVAP